MTKDKNKGFWRRKKFLIILLSFVLFLFIGLYFLIQNSAFVNFIGSVIGARLGYKISVQNIYFSPGLNGGISNLKITKLKNGELSLFSPHVDFKGEIRMPLKIAVEKIILQQPKVKFRYEKKKRLDLSFIKKLPTIHLLSIKRGEFDLSFAKYPYIIRVNDINLEMRDFSPNKGGRITFNGNLEIFSNNYGGITGDGNIKAQFKFSRIFPEPVGKGSLDLFIDSGLVKSASFKNLVLRLPISVDKGKITFESVSINLDYILYKEKPIRNLKFRTSVYYDLKTGIINSHIIEGRLSDLGVLKGSFKGILRDNFSWDASFETSSINFSKVYSLLKPLFPPDYQRWFINGTGVIETHLKGNYIDKDKRLSWNGEMVLYFKEGEFSSSDGTKAGQGIEGKVVLKIRPSSSDKKVNFELSSDVGEGEFLWGRYYKDFSGERIKFDSQGSFFLNFSSYLEFYGSLDIFRTGEYNISGLIQKDKTIFTLKAHKISHSKILSIFKDYLSQNYPSFSNTQFDGSSQLEMIIVRKAGKINIEGVFEIKNTSLNIPDKSMSLNQLSLILPFDLFYPSPPEYLQGDMKKENGYLKIGILEKDKIKLEGLSFPLVLSRNDLNISEDVVINLFGGKLKISNFKARDILSSSRRFIFSLGVQGADISLFSQGLKEMGISGLLEADFPEIRYQDGALYFQGGTVIEIFGGEVEVTNLLVRDIFSKTRNISGDIIFKDIDLEKVTENIKIGKMTGIVEGSIRNLEIEYGQPSRFILDIDSVKRRGVQQKISVDAVENISILGTGSEGIGKILKSGIRSFFKEYPYSKIGIRCTLENDKFSIRGKIHSGGTEYLVRRAFLWGIDVVNQNPDNIISFKDIQERIKRIFRAKEEKRP